MLYNIYLLLNNVSFSVVVQRFFNQKLTTYFFMPSIISLKRVLVIFIQKLYITMFLKLDYFFNFLNTIL